MKSGVFLTSKKPFDRRKAVRLRILITAGPTREMLDPVRFISNVSTGHMGYAIAREAVSRGSEVFLVSGPTSLKPPRGAQFVSITSAEDLQRECKRIFPSCDMLIMVAAVCDFTASKKETHKIKRVKRKTLQLKRTPDIVAGLAAQKGERTVIGFCLETEHWLKNAKNKLKRKNLDGIVANYYGEGHIPFGSRKINTAFLDTRNVRHYRQTSKKKIASDLLSWAEGLHKKRYPIKQK